MAKETKKRPFYYRRAKWDDQKNSPTLQKILEQCASEFPMVGDRTFTVGENEIRGADVDPRPGEGVFLHIASYTPDEATTTIEKEKTAKKSKLFTETASTGRDFLGGDIFIFVRDNHLILCPSGVRENVAQTFIYLTLKKLGYEKILSSFSLEKIAKASKIKMIANEGVSAIQLNSSLYDASIAEINHSTPNNHKGKIDELMKKASELFADMFSKDPELSQIREQENLDIRLSLHFDGREARKKGKPADFGRLGKARLKKTSEEIIKDFEAAHESDEGFKIVTGSGNVITQDEIRVSDSYNVKVFGKSIDKGDTFDKLKQYYDKLKASGVLAQ